MKVSKSMQPGACEAIEAEFVFGPVRCMVWTDFVTEDDGETFYVCERHIAASRQTAAGADQ